MSLEKKKLQGLLGKVKDGEASGEGNDASDGGTPPKGNDEGTDGSSLEMGGLVDGRVEGEGEDEGGGGGGVAGVPVAVTGTLGTGGDPDADGTDKEVSSHFFFLTENIHLLRGIFQAWDGLLSEDELTSSIFETMEEVVGLLNPLGEFWTHVCTLGGANVAEASGGRNDEFPWMPWSPWNTSEGDGRLLSQFEVSHDGV